MTSGKYFGLLYLLAMGFPRPSWLVDKCSIITQETSVAVSSRKASAGFLLSHA